MHPSGFDIERNHSPNRGVDSCRQRSHDESPNMMSAASGRWFPKYRGTEGSDSTEPRSGSCWRPGEPSQRQRDAQMLFHRLCRRSDDPGLRPDRP